MHESKIVAILPNSHLVDSLGIIQRRLGLDFPIYHKQVQEALVQARASIQSGAKVIISRGLTAEFLRKFLDVPVVDIDYDFFQFAEAMRRALKISKTIAVIGFIDAYRLAERAVDYIRRSDETVFVRILETSAFVENTIRDFIDQGAQVFVGGNTVVRNARSLGCEGVYVEPDDKLLEAAIEKARYELRIYLEREEKFETIQAIVNSAANGIFAINGNGVVSVANPLAQKYLKNAGLSEYSASIRNLLPGTKLFETIKTGQTINEDFITLGDTEVVMSAAPVLVDGEIRGAVATIQEIGKIQDLDHKIRKKLLHKGHIAVKTFSDIIGESPVMQQCKRTALHFASVDSTVLILGKTGTGKEVFAQSIHNASRRAAKPFVAVNCAALPSSLLESELFGYVKGAFTGARTEGKAGIFELAHTGTIFLDEISEIPPEVQARLLRVVQEKEIARIGDDKVIPVDVRILVATNRDLFREVREGRFREDLYYRLSVLELRLPELKERSEDIPDLIRYLIKTICTSASRTVIKAQDDAIAVLKTMQLNGNVRELANVVEKILVMSNYKSFDLASVQAAIGPSLNMAAGIKDGGKCKTGGDELALIECGSIAEMEKAFIVKVLDECGQNKAAAARRLGISQTTLWRRLKALRACP
ncbi:MAG: sigma 54-interacting transcriptional regulator [bacterium]|jgi:transcriptional regulator with PAS, ATPase and Fis domain